MDLVQIVLLSIPTVLMVISALKGLVAKKIIVVGLSSAVLFGIVIQNGSQGHAHIPFSNIMMFGTEIVVTLCSMILICGTRHLVIKRASNDEKMVD